MTQRYDDEDVVILEIDRDRVRQTPHVYTRNKKLGGIIHLFVEALDNAIDEYLINGTDIFIRFDDHKKEMTVSDNGRGMPHGKMQGMCEVLNSSSKYGNKGDGKTAYGTSIGQNGMGMKIINFLSDYMTVTSKRKGIKKTITYIDGLHAKTTEDKCKKSEHGTTITFKPSKEYLHAKSIDKLSEKHILDAVEKRMYGAGPDLKVTLVVAKKNGKESIKEYTGYTLEKYVKDLSKGKNDKTFRLELIPEKDEENFRGGQFVFQFSDDTEMEALDGFANTLYTKDGGKHIEGARTAISEFFRKEATTRLSQSDRKTINIRSEDVMKAFVGVITVMLVEPEFKGQVKDELETSIEKLLAKAITTKLKSDMTDKDLIKICSIIKDNAKGRIESTKITKAIKKGSSVSKFSKDSVENYIRISPKSKSEYTEIYFAEGLSAANAMKLARDPDSQAIMPVKGKPVNYFRKSKIQILKSQFIQDLAKILGIEPFSDEVPAFNRLVIATDADIDGDAMAASLMVLFYIVFPGVIKAGLLYKAIFPLYKIGEKNPVYLIDNMELSKYTTKEFMKKNKLYYKNSKFTRSRTINFIETNINYGTLLKSVSNKQASSKFVIELAALCLNLHGKSDLVKWKKEFKAKFPHVEVTKTKLGIELNGIDEGEKTYQTIIIDKDFIKDTKELCSIIQMNYNCVYGYEIEKEGKEYSLFGILKKINKSLSGKKDRFKGLGEMDPEELFDTTLNRAYRKSYKITVGDVDEARMSIEMLHGGATIEKKNFFIKLVDAFHITHIET